MKPTYIFIETGERRQPSIGEWYMDTIGDIKQCTCCVGPQFVTDKHMRPILTRHEIRIEDLATYLSWQTGFDINRPLRAGYIFIPCYEPVPRKKVKVYQWMTQLKNGRFRVTESRYSNAEEAAMEYPDTIVSYPIGDSEREI
jgi:hypothetical protein